MNSEGIKEHMFNLAAILFTVGMQDMAINLCKATSPLEAKPKNKHDVDSCYEYLNNSVHLNEVYPDDMLIVLEELETLFNLHAWGMITEDSFEVLLECWLQCREMNVLVAITKAGWWVIPEVLTVENYDEEIDKFVVDKPQEVAKLKTNPKSINSIFGQIRRNFKGSVDNKVLMERLKHKLQTS